MSGALQSGIFALMDATPDRLLQAAHTRANVAMRDALAEARDLHARHHKYTGKV